MLSRRHWNVSSSGGVRSSVPTNSNFVSLELLSGASSIVVSGGALSIGSMTDHSYSAASSSWSSPSVAITRRLWSPAISPSYWTGGMHGSNGSRSSEHSYVGSAVLASKSMIAVVLRVSPPVAGSSGVSGGVKPVDSGCGPGRNFVAMPSRFHV